jgi:hypothetical protein
MEHGLSPFGRADLHPRRNPLDRQMKGSVPENILEVDKLVSWVQG